MSVAPKISGSFTAARLLPWLPLLAGTLCSYGPVGYNYGFALYFLDYRHGFVKRGLVGEMFSHASYLTRGQLLLIEYLFLAAAFALTYIVFRRSLFSTDVRTGTLTAVLLSAPAALPHIGYLFAQPDVTLYLILLLCLLAFLCLPPVAAAALSLPLCCVALLAHEAFLLMFYPLIAAVLLHLCQTRKLPWLVGALHVAVVLAAFVAVVHFGTLKVSPDTVLAEAQARTSVGIQRQVYDVMGSTLAEQRALVRQMYTPGVVHVLELTLALSLPYFALLAWLLRRGLRAAGTPALQQVVTAALFLMPLLLCAFGHDTTRWIGAMCLDTSLFTLFLLMTEPPAAEPLLAWAENPAAVLPWLGYLLAIGPYGATGLRSAEQMVTAWMGR